MFKFFTCRTLFWLNCKPSIAACHGPRALRKRGVGGRGLQNSVIAILISLGAVGIAGPVAACTFPTGLVFSPIFSGHPSIKANGGKPGEPASDWSRNSFKYYATRCDSWVSAYPRVKSNVKGIGSYKSGSETYTIYPTGVEGLGIIFKANVEAEKPIVGNGWITLKPAGIAIGREAFSFILNSRLIRVGRIDPGKKTVALGRMLALQHGTPDGGATDLAVAITEFDLNVIDNPGCKLATSSVPLRSVETRGFNGSGPGAVSADQGYRIDLDCDAAVGNVEYQFNPLSAPVDVATSAYALSNEGDSDAAKGVGIQYLDGDGKPHPVGKWTPFGNASSPGKLSKDLKVRYRRTLADEPSPGITKASVQVLIAFP